MGSGLIWVKSSKPICAKTPKEKRVFQPGEIFQVNPDKAKPLIESRMLEEVNTCDALQVDDFKKQNIAVRIRSTVLGEDFWLVSNEDVRQHLNAEGLTCYLPDEIAHIRNIHPEGIRKLHMIKKGLGGKTRIIQAQRKSRLRDKN